jgi:HSP20 family protein
MSELTLWKEKEMTKLRRDIDRLFNRFCYDFGLPFTLDDMAGAAAFNLSETDDQLILEAKLPGMKPEDMDISVTDDALSINGQVREETVKEDAQYQRVERRSGSFSRRIPLPCKVKIDDITATYKDGTLKITMPKCEGEAARGVQIKVN